MIYICKIFSLPCTLAEKICQGCSTVCKESCKAFGEACSAITNCWKPVSQGPLGSYVIGTWVVMALCIGMFGMTVSQLEGCDTVSMFSLINIGLAVLHCLAAFYIQRRIITHIANNGGDTTSGHYSARDITHSAWEVAKYDIGFCLYVFAFIGAAAYNAQGIKDFKDCDKGSGPAWGASVIKIMYAFLVWNYFFCWYGCQMCCGAKEAHQERQAPAQQGVPAQQVGAP